MTKRLYRTARGLAALALVWVALGAAAVQAAGPSTKSAPAKSAAAAPPAPVPTQPTNSAPAPYEPELLRLSEIIGSLSYLRDLCGDGDGAAWRDKMTSLLQSQTDSSERRQRMAGAYNKGYRDYELVYRTCTDNAKTVIANYLDEGGRVTRDVASRFGGG